MDNGTVRKQARGFTLIEIMIALAISLILLAGVFTIMSSSKRTYTLQAELAKLQENARFAMEELAYGIRMAGYAGCSGKLPSNQKALTGNSRDIRKATRQSNGTYKLANTTGLEESDVLTMTFLDDELASKGGITTVKDNDRLIDFLDFTNSIVQSKVDEIMVRPSNERTLILSDCGGSQTFKLIGNSVQSARIQRQSSAQRSIFNEPVEAFVSASSLRYEVAQIVRTDGQETFGLFFSMDGGTIFNLLVEGVQQLKMAYNVDAKSNNKNIQVSNSPVRIVRNVRINLLMRTTERRFDIGYQMDKEGNKLEELGPFAVSPEEGYRYRLFSTLIQVRNGNG